MDTLVRVGAKIGSNKVMVAIRDSFAALMPLVMAGAFAVLMNNVFFVPWSLLAKIVGHTDEAPNAFITWADTNIAPFFGAVDAGAFAILSLGLVFALGYNMAKIYEADTLSTGLVSVGAFFILGVLQRTSLIAGYITNYLGAQGIFVALFTGLVASIIFIKITKKGWVITMPEMVPPAVGRAFAAIIPGVVALLSFALIAYIFTKVPALQTADVMIPGATPDAAPTATPAPKTIFNFVEANLAGILEVAFGGKEGAGMLLSAFLTSIISLFVGLFWAVGLHGANIMAPVMDGIFLGWGTENASQFAATGSIEGLRVWVRVSWDAYVFMGGSGATIALLAAIFAVGTREEDREIAKLSFVPGLFQINEPVIFGLPIVLNPIYAVPFIIIQPVLTFIAYIATAVGLVPPLVNIIPWTTPPVIGALMASNWSLMAGLLAVVNLGIAFVIYIPFVRAANKIKEPAEGHQMFGD
ncbi:MAG: PTS sugar transporter subunit IIC [Mycoplasmatales bacterium]